MNLFDLLAQGQGNDSLQSLGKQFGLSAQQTQSAVEALLPAFSKGLQQTASTPQGLGSLLTMMAGGQDLQGTAAGNGVLGELFGSKDLSRAVAAQASQASGVGQDVLKQMLPALATMLMGGLAKQTNQQMAAGTFGASNPLGEIIEQMMRQGQAPAAPQRGNNPLGDILEQVLKGGGQQPTQTPQSGNNPLSDILGQILGGGKQQPQSGNNPLGDILEQILRQNGGQARPQTGSARQRTQKQPEQPSNNPLEDMLGKMFRPGGQAEPDQQYQQGIDNIFEQFRRGVDRRTR